MSQISLKETADPPPPSSHPNDMHRGESGDQGTSDLLQSPRPSRRVLDNLKDFTYDPIEQSRDPLDTWPGQVEMRPRRRSTLLSSLIRGNQPHRSFFGEDDESEPTAAVKNQLSRPLNNARRLSKTAVSALKEKVPLPPLPWKQKRSLSQSANSRAPVDQRKKFILLLAKAFLTFGAPSHRVETQLFAAADKLRIRASFAYIPGIIMVSFNDGETRTTELHFVRSSGRIALSALNNVHDVYRDAFDDRATVPDGISALDRILRAAPLYPLIVRCGLAFVCASVICPLAFGGSFIDMWVSGTCACVLQYLGLQAAAKSSVYANVYEISVSIIVSFVARSLSSIPGRLFCYSSISSAGVVLILPGFTILISALELTSRNILCGSVRLIYAIIYTFFLGFGLTIGSDLSILLVNHKHYDSLGVIKSGLKADIIHGVFTAHNASNSTSELSFAGTFGFVNATNSHVSRGCYRDPDWPWFRQPFPWWTMFFLVPLYSTCSSLSNLQSFRSARLPIMIIFSCCSYTANKASNWFLSDKGAIASAAGALVIGLLGNIYSRWSRGTAFTSMVTGVLFLVPSGLAQAGGLTGNYDSSVQQYYSSFTLGLRMIQVAIGVTIGLFVSQSIIYALSAGSSAVDMAF
ncbi:hypothetical protein DFH94DRAFT_853120 [Russula ochroleuca]|uniref:Threonine/serine exporter-like N-terminal domain-containing protein n=1 Tax=Russula ochroleuca TaxID=152965 RepID=A0A9P5MX80_9AGAM|nr:hypothetical protein DFH94DRAFT_853120 [Russula ochroleuca]